MQARREAQQADIVVVNHHLFFADIMLRDTGMAELLRVSGGLGIGESAKFLKKQQSLLWRFFVPGGYSPDKIIRGLAPHLGQPDNNLAGFHVFTFNDLEPTEEWRQQALRRFQQQVSSSGPVRPDAGRPEPEHL